MCTRGLVTHDLHMQDGHCTLYDQVPIACALPLLHHSIDTYTPQDLPATVSMHSGRLHLCPGGCTSFSSPSPPPGCTSFSSPSHPPIASSSLCRSLLSRLQQYSLGSHTLGLMTRVSTALPVLLAVVSLPMVLGASSLYGPA